MAAQRRLQTEIDRCLKRVGEGLQEFQDIWDKVHDTDHSAQREKHEADLKKEIKKLQRLRDQIKTWISSAEVKDKTQLLDARRSIEREMERFKLCEKEAKMKAFSKAALGQADKLDPREQAKAEAREWINSAVDTLNEQIEKYEYEIEELAAAGGKKKAKPPARIEFLQSVITVHRKHTIKLEAALRALDNDALEPEGLDAVRDGLDYYLSQEDSEHYDNVDDLYADIADTLEAVETVAGPGTLVSHGSKGGSIGGKEGRERSASKGGAADEEKERERERERERAAAAAAKAQLVAQGAIVKSVDEEDGRPAGVRAGVRPPAVAPPGGGGGTPTPSPGVPASPGARGLAALQLPPAARPFSDGDASGGLARQDSGAGVLTSPQQGPMSPDGAAAPSPAAESGNGSGSVMSPLAAAASAAAGPGALRPGGPLSPQSAAAAAAAAGQGAPSGGRLGAWMAGAPAAAAGEPGKPGPGGKGPAAAGAAPVATGQQQKGAMEEMAAPAGGAVVPAGGSPAAQAAPSAPPPAAAAAAGEGADTPAPAAPPPGAAGALASADALADGVAGLSLDSSASGAAAFEVLSRLAGQDLGLGQLSTAPVGVAGSGAPASGGPMPALGVLDAAFRTGLPQPVDSDWARSRPRHPVATPPSFPRSSPEIMSAPGLFRRMDPEALFFAFYYQPDTYQQYLAAQELKRQSWRYHKHHNAWFQRYAEPSVTNDEYEQGTYVYFDFHVVHDDLQSGWCYRRKENFVFRYDALEDDLPVAL